MRPSYYLSSPSTPSILLILGISNVDKIHYEWITKDPTYLHIQAEKKKHFKIKRPKRFDDDDWRSDSPLTNTASPAAHLWEIQGHFSSVKPLKNIKISTKEKFEKINKTKSELSDLKLCIAFWSAPLQLWFPFELANQLQWADPFSLYGIFASEFFSVSFLCVGFFLHFLTLSLPSKYKENLTKKENNKTTCHFDS